jgi:suppressor for copper-sensitivity B
MATRLALPATLAALALAPTALRAAVGPWLEHGAARVRLVSRLARGAPGADAGLGVEFRLAPGWHVYWKNPGDAGYPPRLVFASGVEDATLRYPAPERFDLPGDLVAIGYEDEVVYPVDGRLAATGSANAAHLAARIDYLVCAESCVPHAGDLTLDLPLGARVEDSEVAATVDRWRARLPVAVDEHAVVARLAAGRDGSLDLTLTLALPGLTIDTPDLFFESDPRFTPGRPRFTATPNGPTFAVSIRPLDESHSLPDLLPLAWTATGVRTPAGATALEGRLALDLPRPKGYRAAVVAAAALLAAVVVLVAVAANRRRWRTNAAHL